MAKSKGIIVYWSDADDAQLRAMLAEGVSRAEMAVRLRRTPKAIKSRLKRMETVPGTKAACAAAKPWECAKDDPGHIAAVLRASPYGFPFYDLQAQYRVAA